MDIFLWGLNEETAEHVKATLEWNEEAIALLNEIKAHMQDKTHLLREEG